MSISVERNGFSNILQLGYQVVYDLVQSGGFQVVAVDKATTSGFSSINSHYVLKPLVESDPLADDLVQPWRLVLEFNNTAGYIKVWVCTPTQLDDSWNVGEYETDKEAGFLGVDNLHDSTATFWSNDSTKTFWSCYKDQGIDPESIPLSYQLNVTDHGVFFSLWAESFDKAGDCFCWFNIQRPVDCDTGLIVSDGKAPLMCVFSRYGNSDAQKISDAPDDKVANSILYFTVRESDVNMPEPPRSAVVPVGDSYPIINPLQQVAILEDGSYTVRFPQGFNTQRYLYDYKLDMIAYTSADVLSQWSKPKFTVFGEETQRTYKALNANFPNNSGMRVLCQIAGQGF
ncbi:hypothetical protein BN7874_246 [Phage NCTB]|nr:hypothetical protein BN7874_246 [Phage NCTB]